MTTNNSQALPSHFVPLLQPTPSGTAKLIAAWDGLSPESQIQLLNEMRRANFPSYLAERVYVKALDNKNAYAR